MQKTINLDGREVRVEMTADTLRVYRQVFGLDLIVEMMDVVNSIQNDKPVDLEIIENLFFICAAACDPEITDINEWLRQFSTLSIYMATSEIIDMWIEENKTIVQRKKKVDLPSEE